MKSIALRNKLSLALLLSAATVPMACAMPASRIASASILHDPLIGLPFDPTRKGFEPVQSDLTKRCPELANARYTQQLWLFAEAEQDGQRYLIVGGRFVPRRAGDRPIENAVGTLLRLGADGCTLIGPAAELFAMPDAYDDSVPVPIRSALAADAARRFIKHHGGATGLGAAMRHAGKSVTALPPTLQTAFAGIRGLPR